MVRGAGGRDGGLVERICSWGVGVRMVVDRLIPFARRLIEVRREARSLPSRGWPHRGGRLRQHGVWARAETPEGFAFRMSVSTDHAVMPAIDEQGDYRSEERLV